MLKNITLSADEKLIESARACAREKQTTLNEEFRRWLADYANVAEDEEEDLTTFIARLQSYVKTGGRTWTREERNE